MFVPFSSALDYFDFGLGTCIYGAFGGWLFFLSLFTKVIQVVFCRLGHFSALWLGYEA
ncbi:hypothetical protein QBC46DRAFT_292585 [Diplogelasinospora grovesii]|uniref:Uncharacterized protein n=1 Tax=Diplogelasinospora grovesii TaxID=303347 RepID=A0AAN6N4N4_9PEZI|nr:hypothetical protein QBC46DRAFT_292585 [Diplogelasinospora grovesii]